MDAFLQSVCAIKQKGVIVKYHGCHKSSLIYSPISGNAILLPIRLHSLMKLGSVVRYNIYKRNNMWHAFEVEYLGEKLQMVPNIIRKGQLYLSVNAIVHRVDDKMRNAWMWNDAIGRIHVPEVSFCDYLKPFDIVYVTIVYEGFQEDIPWRAVKVIPLCNILMQAFLKPQISTHLNTCYGWTVNACKYSTNRKNFCYYTTLYHAKLNVFAFAASSDYIRGQDIVSVGDECIVTWVRQKLIGKTKVRAVAVTVMKDISSHTD